MLPNTNPITGVRYGVIATNSLNPDLVDTLFYGSQATNVTEEDAYAEIEADLRNQYEDLVDQARWAAAESGADREADFNAEAYEERWFEEHKYEHDEDGFVERGFEDAQQDFYIEEPTITGTHEGGTYRIGWLGGASLLWVVEGPTGNARSLCSLCVPNAANLDSNYVLDSELDEDSQDNVFPCYCVPRDWLF